MRSRPFVAWGRPFGEGEGLLGAGGCDEGVSGRGGEIDEKRSEAATGRPSSVYPVVCLLTAAGAALATAVGRDALPIHSSDAVFDAAG
jgi:hypothetical protein